MPDRWLRSSAAYILREMTYFVALLMGRLKLSLVIVSRQDFSSASVEGYTVLDLFPEFKRTEWNKASLWIDGGQWEPFLSS